MATVTPKARMVSLALRVPFPVYVLVFTFAGTQLVGRVHSWTTGESDLPPELTPVVGGLALLWMASLIKSSILFYQWSVRDKHSPDKLLLPKSFLRTLLSLCLGGFTGLVLFLEIFTHSGRESLHLLPGSSFLIFVCASSLVWRDYEFRVGRHWNMALTISCALLALAAAASWNIEYPERESWLNLMGPALAGALIATGPIWIYAWRRTQQRKGSS